MWPSPSRQRAGRSRGPRGTPVCYCRSQWGWMRLRMDVSSGTSAAGSTWHPLAPGILAFQLVTGSGPLPRACRVPENGQILVHFSPPESLGPSLACPQHLGFRRGQLLPAATLTPSVSFQLIPCVSFQLIPCSPCCTTGGGGGVSWCLGQNLWLPERLPSAGLGSGSRGGYAFHRAEATFQASCFPQFSPAPQDRRVAAGPGGF